MSILPARTSSSYRWVQLILGIVCMASVANLQYGWTLFVLPIQHQWGWSKAEIQVAFTIFIILETWLVPFEGWIVDRIGPRWMVLAGAAITIAPIRSMIQTSGYQHTFLVFGIIYGVIIVVVSNFIRAPRTAELPDASTIKLPQSAVDVPPSQAVRSPIFWIMYLMFFLVAAGGLMSAAQLAPIANERGIADATVVLFGISMPAIVAALTFHNITNGVGRPLNGWISDHIGRANMMGVAFGIEAICLAAFGFFGTTPMSFIVTDGLVFLFCADSAKPAYAEEAEMRPPRRAAGP